MPLPCSSLPTLYFSIFALSCRLCPVAPCSAFKRFCSPDSRLYEIIYLLAGLHPLDLSSPATPLLFLPLLYFLPPYSSGIPVVALPHAYLLVVVPAISFLCHCIPAFLRFFFKARRSTRHFRHLAYKCMTDSLAAPHHQHSAISLAPIRLRNVPIAPCPVFS